MKVTVIGSHLCPDTLYALNRLSEVKAEIEFKNLSASLPDLKAYLALRDSDPHYEAVKKNGGIGIPAFVREAGTVPFDLGFVLKLFHNKARRGTLTVPRRVSAVLQTSVTAPVPPSSICRRAARVPRVVPSWVSRIAVRDSSSVVMHFAMATAVA